STVARNRPPLRDHAREARPCTATSRARRSQEGEAGPVPRDRRQEAEGSARRAGTGLPHVTAWRRVEPGSPLTVAAPVHIMPRKGQGRSGGVYVDAERDIMDAYSEAVMHAIRVAGPAVVQVRTQRAPSALFGLVPPVRGWDRGWSWTPGGGGSSPTAMWSPTQNLWRSALRMGRRERPGARPRVR